jgi:DegV family protein with EDD domain
LASTIRSVIDNTRPLKSYKQTVSSIADAALLGARGNSGVIFAQFLYGINRETKDKTCISLTDFAESIMKSIPYIYKAIANPVEGTMLTVIKDWSYYLDSKKEFIYDFKSVFIDSLYVIEKSLVRTTGTLKVLEKSGFVDAGAKGFVLFIKGVIDFIENTNVRSLVSNNIVSIPSFQDSVVSNEDICERYCSEAIIRDLNIDVNDLKIILDSYGDSIVVAGSKDLTRIHIHTNKPDVLFNRLSSCGTITYQKVDDMIRQHEVLTNRKWNIALVSDSTCDLSDELIDYYQIHIVPMNLSFGDTQYLDKVTIKPNKFYDLLNTEVEFPKTSQINEQVFTNLYSHLASEYDAIIAVHLTDKFSGTYSNSVKAAERIMKESNKDIHVIDSKNLSGALGLIVLKAARSIEEGNDVDSIVSVINQDIDNTKIFVSVKDIKYMIRGGRVSKKKGLIAKILGVNPIVSMDSDGNSLLFDKAFGQKSGLKKIYKHICQVSQGCLEFLNFNYAAMLNIYF